MPRKAIDCGVLTVAKFAKALADISYAHNTDVNFRNFIEAAYCACAARTAPNIQVVNALEARYMAVATRYGDEKQRAMMAVSKLFSRLAEAAHEYSGDFLGETFMMEEVCFKNTAKGQFFTPYGISKLCARLKCSPDVVESAKAENRPVIVLDPACGSGGMVLAIAEAMSEQGFEPQEFMLATLVDVDPVCMQMAFLQMWLKNIPAICVHGNSLTLEEFERASTPGALLQRWPDESAPAVPASSSKKGEQDVESPAVQPIPVHGEPTVLETLRHSKRPPDVCVQRDLFGDPV
jgi:hypothetical protein